MDDVTSKRLEILREHLQYVGDDEELRGHIEGLTPDVDLAGVNHGWGPLRGSAR